MREKCEKRGNGRRVINDVRKDGKGTKDGISTLKSSLEVLRVPLEWKKMDWGYGNKLEFSQNEKKVKRYERMPRKRIELVMQVSWLLGKKPEKYFMKVI